MTQAKSGISQNEIYALADNLQMVIEKAGKSLTGQIERSIKFGDMRLEFTQKIVSSAVLDAGGAIIVGLAGDLGVMAVSRHPYTTAYVLDLVQLSEKRGVGFLEAAKVKTAETAFVLVEHATKARFERKGHGVWSAMP